MSENCVTWSINCVEFPAGVASKDSVSAADDDSQPDRKETSASTVQKLLIQSMLNSVQAMLKQQKGDHLTGGQY